MKVVFNSNLSAELSERTIRALEAAEKANAAYDVIENDIYGGESANFSELENIMRENARIAVNSGYTELLSIGVREWYKI